MEIKTKSFKMSSESVAISVFSIMFVLVIVFNVIVGIVVIRMKRQKEEEAVDRKRHIDVFHASLACLNVLGACLVYPTLIIQVLKTNSGVCTFLTSTAAFYMSCTAVLITAINIHSLYSSLRPFHYFTYLRKRNSKIPFAFVLLSVSVGIVSLVLSACDYSLFRLIPGFYYGIPACVPELRKSAVVYYFVAMIHLVFWFNVVLLVEDLPKPTCRDSDHEEGIFGGGTDYCGWRTRGACFHMMRLLLYFISWSPFTVVSTMLVSGYDISNDVIVTSCYVMLVPAGLILPIVFYVTHHDWREVFYECVNEFLASIRRRNESRDHAHPVNNADAMELQIVR